jgi:flagellar motility protein MotE (MotC chaperone)
MRGDDNLSEVKRKGIPKKLRFEVFKRDNFTCQYCGRMAPDVILEVDHINPVKNGGKNDILNLITSCKDCNSGKGAKELTDNQIVKQQQEQLKEINEKREQLKLMLQWKKELEKFDDEQVDIIDNMIKEVSERCLSEYGRNNIKKHIKKFGITEVIESTKISIEQYYKGNDDNISKVIDYIPRICQVRKKSNDDPMFGKRNYIKGIMRNRFGIYNEKRVNAAFNDVIDTEEAFETAMDIAKQAKNWTRFWEWFNEEFNTDY